VQQTINIPRISVMPKGEVKAGFKSFTLDLSGMTFNAPDQALYAKYLDRNEGSVIGMSQYGLLEERLEDYVVSGLIDFPDIAYDQNADLLYDLAGQVVRHLSSYLSENDVQAVLKTEQPLIAKAVRAQMLDHYWEDDTVEYESVVKQGFSEIKASAHTSDNQAPRDYKISPADKSNMARYLFGGFNKCLSEVARFHSDSERRLVVILEREAQKWFRPAKGQFQIFYRKANDQREYVPDFVAETETYILMMEPKMVSQMDDPDVLAKRNAAIEWCKLASIHAASCGGKPWRYVLIPHDQIQDNMSIGGLVTKFGV
jgi:type III restriction enzyme